MEADRELCVALAEPYFPIFTGTVQQAWREFDTWIPGTDRVTVERSRPKVMSLRIMALLEAQFGRSGSPRVEERSQLTYLVIEGDDIQLGVRFKKFDSNDRSFNHPSEQQYELRAMGLYPWLLAYHVFVGYRVKPGLVPRLASIAMTFENQSEVVWRHMLWTEDEGQNPVQEISPPLLPPSDELPTPPVVRRKKSRRDRKDKEGAG
jgi:hypothetical protein